VLTDASAINDEGQIVGTGTHDGQRHAFLMTPDPSFSVADLHPANLSVPLAGVDAQAFPTRPAVLAFADIQPAAGGIVNSCG